MSGRRKRAVQAAGVVAAAVILLVSAVLNAGRSASPPALDPGLSEVEIADEWKEIVRGLMFRRHLCPECGMIFVFPDSRMRSFWMKNTLIPLDMIFMEEDGGIVQIHRRTVPGRTSPGYSSGSPARFVLEVNAGFAKQRGFEVGGRIDLPALWERAVEYRWIDPK